MTKPNVETMNDLQAIQQLEALSANAWNAPYSNVYDGWLIRYANGYTRRANAVLPLYPSKLPLADKLAYCEQFYMQRALPTYFKITEASEPAALDGVLSDFGYTASAHTSVQTLKLQQWESRVDLNSEALDVRSYPSKIWLGAFYDLNSTRAMHHAVAHQMLNEHLLQPANFVLLWEKQDPVAIALLVHEQQFTGIFDVIVHSERRGQGVGQQLMQYLLALAQQAGSHTAYLQVMLNNERALRLYASLGFSEQYRYWYREKPLPV